MRLKRLALKLADIQMMIEPAPIEQLLVGAALDNLAVVDDHHLIGIADGAETVRDHETGAALHQAEQRLLNARFRARIDAARRFV